MTQRNETGQMTFTAGEDLEPYRRVKLSAARTVSYADAGEEAIGVTVDRVLSGEQVTVHVWNRSGTFEIEAAAGITVNATVYGTADGKIDDTGSGLQVGIALVAAAGAGEVIEVMHEAGGGVDQAAVVAAIDDDTGGTTSGTEQLNAVCAEIDDDAGGTNAGTEQLNATVAGAIDDDSGGTNAGTEQLNEVTFTGGSSGHGDLINNNLAVIATQLNAIATRTNNNLAVLATEMNELRDGAHNNLAVLGSQVNAILTALKTAKLMASS